MERPKQRKRRDRQTQTQTVKTCDKKTDKPR